VFFFHNKLANNFFSHNFPDQRIGSVDRLNLGSMRRTHAAIALCFTIYLSASCAFMHCDLHGGFLLVFLVCGCIFWRRGATTDTRAWSTKWWRTPRRSGTPLPTFFARPTTRRSARARSLLFTGRSRSESTGERCKKMSREPGRRSASLIFSCNGLHTPSFAHNSRANVYWVFGPCQGHVPFLYTCSWSVFRDRVL